MKFFSIIFLVVFSIFLSKSLSGQNPDSLANKNGVDTIKIDTTLEVVKNGGIKIDSAKISLDTLAEIKPDSFQDNSMKKSRNFLNNFLKKDYPNPRKAALMSLVLPGSGQIYNKSYWKLPIVYGSLAATITVESFYVKLYREYKTAYFNKVNNLPQELPKYDGYDATSIKRARDGARKKVEFWGLLIGINVLLITAEAFTDAHLKNFDVSDDLSLRVKPTIFQTNSGSAAVGLGLGFCFR